MEKVCGVKSCAKRLDKENIAGVCLEHSHAAGICQCKKCSARPPDDPEVIARSAAKAKRVRQVLVPYATSNSGVDARASISVVREPWL